ncbi:MAG: NAD+ synthase [Candidatus Thorarchaeota archaeon]
MLSEIFIISRIMFQQKTGIWKYLHELLKLGIFCLQLLGQKSLLVCDAVRNGGLEMKVVMAQVNPIVGDINGNLAKVIEKIKASRELNVDIVAFPEMVIPGYPPQDLLHERAFIKANHDAINSIADLTKGIVAVVGFVDSDNEGLLYNAAAIYENGKLRHVVHKTLLPTYDVFDEERYFEPSESIIPVTVRVKEHEILLGVEICEDLWDDDYDEKVTDILCAKGARIIINISASPFHVGKQFERERLVREKTTKNETPFFLVNLVGGQDELVFDGRSIAIDSKGHIIALGNQFEEDLIVTDLDIDTGEGTPIAKPAYDEDAEMYNALVLGIKDYFRKTGFKKAVLGLSGGIDSSLTACIAVDAIGSENVIGVSMPSKYSSNHSKSDAELLAENLGIKYIQIPIQEIVNSYHDTWDAPLMDLRAHFGVDISQDDPVADENIQPRTRGNILMDISNRLKDLRILVLNTGNKTEIALGYCTLYGDMTGGVGVIGDVSKLEVYRLSEYVNRKAGKQVIPEGSITKKPSAELKENQFDPFDFDIVSPMVDEIVANRRGKLDLLDMGYPKDVIEDVYRRVRLSEYKRWQAPPCIRITKKSFGMGWKMPIVNHFWE